MKHLKLFEDNETIGNSKFIAVIHQSGGCDYTIACGTKVIELESTDIDSANTEISSIIEEEYPSDMGIESVVLYEVKSTHEIDIESIYSEISNKNRLSDVDREEKEEYERLKRKFG